MNAVIVFTKDSAISPGGQVNVRLVTQDEGGVYVLPAKGSKATYIPKSAIGALVFSINRSDIIR